MAESQCVLETWLNIFSPEKETGNLQHFPALFPPSASRTLAACLRLSKQKAEDDKTTRKKNLKDKHQSSLIKYPIQITPHSETELTHPCPQSFETAFIVLHS